MKITTNHYANSLGKILAKLRIDYDQRLCDQAKYLGVNSSYISMITNNKRTLSYEFYRLIMEKYPEAQEFKNEIIPLIIKEDVRKRFNELFPNATPAQMLYVLYGDEEHEDSEV